jgi:hypothetical protein
MKDILSTPLRTHATKYPEPLLERNETRGVGGTNTWPSVLDRLAVDSLAILATHQIRYPVY